MMGRLEPGQPLDVVENYETTADPLKADLFPVSSSTHKQSPWLA